MEIILEKLGKRYNRNWIFRDVDYRFSTGGLYAILGPNGSGKSTALQTIAGYITPTRGSVQYLFKNRKIAVDAVYKHLSMAAPYMELPEELTLSEILTFHAHFKQPLISIDRILHRINLEKEKDKEILHFSSGMKQRVKLALAILYSSEIVLLDEPSSHLDKDSVQWYRNLVEEYTTGRMLIISSNEPEEYDFCPERIHIGDFKPVKNKPGLPS